MESTENPAPKNPNWTRLEFRRQMPVSQTWAYFDHAAVAPISVGCQSFMQNWLHQACHDGDTRWPQWSAAAEKLRHLASKLLTVSADEIALIPNTSTGIGLVAEGIRWKNGDNVVVPENEFPSNLLPWLNLARRGVETRRFAVGENGHFDVDTIDQAIDQRTRLVSISWVGFLSGFRSDLESICDLVHRRGALLMVDAIQGLGAFPLNLSRIPIDFLAADGHKWMLGPEGAGIAFIRKEHLQSLDQVMVGWGSARDSMKFETNALELKESAAKFEIGSANLVGLGGFAASLEMLLELGCHLSDSPIAKCVLENVDQLARGLRDIGCRVHVPAIEENRSGILSFEIQGKDPIHARHHLMQEGIVVSVRHGRLRASTHAYNDPQDRDRLFNGVRTMVASLR